MTLTQRLLRAQPIIQARRLAPIPVSYGEWLPDLAPYGNPGSTEAQNVIPTADGYRPMPDQQVYSNALDSRAKGAAVGQDTAGTQHVYAGDDGKLYLLTGTTFADASKVGGYSTAADDAWRFAQFQQTMIATNFTDPVQGVAVGGATFADQFTSTLTPTAKDVAVVRNFLVLGHTNDATDGVQPERVWWSGINDPLDMDPAAATQCDFQDQAEGGWVQRVIGGIEYGLVFQERLISRMDYEGSPLIFDFNPIDRKRGTPYPNSVIEFGRLVFFHSGEGFFVNNGLESFPIGHNKVDKKFDDDFDPTHASRISAAVDPVNKLVMWLFPGAGSVAGDPNTIWVYNWVDKKWAHIDISPHLIVRLTTTGYTLDTLDTVGTDIDDATLFPFSFDSRAWTGGSFRLASFDSSFRLNFFDGSNLAAVLETADVQPVAGRRSRVTSARPLVDGGTVTAAVASRARLLDTASFGTAASINGNGECPLRSEGRYHRARTSIAAGGTWTKAQGVELTAHPSGAR